MKFRTSKFEQFIAPAKEGAAFWRLLLGLVVLAVVYFVIVVATGFAAVAVDQTGDPAQAMLALTSGNTRTSMTLILLSFAGAVLGVCIATILVHRRSPLTLFGPGRAMLRDFGIAVGVFFVLQMIMYAGWAFFFDGIPQRSFGSVLAFLPIAAVLILIQTGAEELLFRGYLMQQLAVRFQSPIVWFVIPPIAFGLLHYNPQMMGDLTWVVVIIISITGILWTDLTRVTGNIGAAWGWHFANNFMLMNFLGNSGELNGYVWMTTGYKISELPPALFLVDVGIAIMTWAILRRILRD